MTRYHVCGRCGHQTRGRAPRNLQCRNCGKQCAHWEVSGGVNAAVAAHQISNPRKY